MTDHYGNPNEKIEIDSQINEIKETSDMTVTQESTSLKDNCSEPPSNPTHSSENFKIELKNLPWNISFGQLKKLLNSLKVDFAKIKTPRNCRFAFITFGNENSRDEAIKILNNYQYKGKALEAIHAKVLDTFTAKRKNEKDADQNSKKLMTAESNLTPEEKVQNSVTPLWKKSYDEQIEMKQKEIESFLRKLSFKIDNVNPDIQDWTEAQRKNHNGMCCQLLELVKSPVQESYRNKCEFTIGYDLEEKNIVVGFRIGEYKTGSNEVVTPFCCRNVPNQMKSFILSFHSYLLQSEYKPFNVRTREGNYRQLTIRTNEQKELLVIVIFDKQDLNEENIEKEKSLLRSYFLDGNNAKHGESIEYGDYKLKSILFNLNTNRNGISKMDNLDVLVGDKYLYEKLLNLNFRISPLAFFQANTQGAEVLFNKISDLCEIDKNTVILDICCGTGTIGLTLANRAKSVIGIELIQEAIDDAKFNSELNNIKNVEYFSGKAEDILPSLLNRFVNEKVVAIVDPPRAGLHSKVIQTLRRLENLENLIYVSCNPDLAQNNFVDLARKASKTYQFNAFVPVKAIAVDMFPLTSHCELIIYFKRYSNKSIE